MLSAKSQFLIWSRIRQEIAW